MHNQCSGTSISIIVCNWRFALFACVVSANHLYQSCKRFATQWSSPSNWPQEFAGIWIKLFLAFSIIFMNQFPWLKKKKRASQAVSAKLQGHDGPPWHPLLPLRAGHARETRSRAAVWTRSDRQTLLIKALSFWTIFNMQTQRQTAKSQNPLFSTNHTIITNALLSLLCFCINLIKHCW